MDDFNKQFKEYLINMMHWFHEFCKENDIKYYALGGTMLGVARHHGFIPWDDDIDIGIPRKDYERLARLLKNRKGRYVLETPHSNSKDFYYTYSKLYDTRTTLIENSKTPIKRGIFIDIFPLDGLGNTIDDCRRKYKKIDILRMLLISRITTVRKGRGVLKNVLVLIMNLFPNFLINNKKLQIKIDNLCKQNDFNNCIYGGNLMGHWRIKEVMPTHIMGTPVLYKFENIEIFGVEHYDEYLTKLYGNWRIMPPKDQRITIHDFNCDLNKSYLDE